MSKCQSQVNQRVMFSNWSVRGVGIIALIGLAGILASVAWKGTGEAFYEDRVGHAVRRERYVGWLSYSRKLLFSPPGWDPRNAVWEQGVTRAFQRPFRTNELILIDHNQKRYLMRITEVSEHRIVCELWDSQKGLWNVAETTPMRINLDASFGIDWSFRERDQAFLYASPFIPGERAGDSFRLAIVEDRRDVEGGLNAKTVKWARYPWELAPTKE